MPILCGEAKLSGYTFFHKILDIAKATLLWLSAGFILVIALGHQIEHPYSISFVGLGLAAILLAPPSRALIRRYINLKGWPLVAAIILSAGAGSVIATNEFIERNDQLAKAKGFTSHEEYVKAKSQGFNDPEAFKRFSEAAAEKARAEQRKAEAEAVIAEAKKAKLAMAAARKAEEQAQKVAERRREAEIARAASEKRGQKAVALQPVNGYGILGNCTDAQISVGYRFLRATGHQCNAMNYCLAGTSSWSGKPYARWTCDGVYSYDAKYDGRSWNVNGKEFYLP